MGNRKNIKVHQEFVEVLKAHFEQDQREIPIELRNKSWAIRFSDRINKFIHKDLAHFEFHLAEDAIARYEGNWPAPKTIYRAFIKGFTANPDLIQICGWYVFGDEWPIAAVRFQQNDDQQVEYNTRLVLKIHYLQDSIFNSIRIPGDKSGFFGQLEMDSYYANLSYIEQKDLTDRNTLIKKEQESLRRRFTQVSSEFQHLGADYLSADIIKNNQRIVITGNPGVGKSTYARWLCYQWAKDRLLIQLIPLYIQLRDLDFSSLDTNTLCRYVHRNYFNQLSLAEVEVLLTEQYYNYLLVLDGYDELNRPKQVHLERDLHRLTQPVDRAKYIVLSRPYGLLYHKFDKEIVLQIDGFTESSIENYIQAFLPHSSYGRKQKRQLLRIIEQNYVLKEHAHNPLMLSYIVLIYTKSKQPEEQLFSIKSTYDLQASVFRWLIDYSFGHEQLINAEKDWHEMAGKLAYEMLMKQEFSYTSSIDALPFTREQALQFSQLGIGNIIDDEHDYNWKFSFTTVTLQEFLASHYLLPRITADAFVYLVQDQYHWNFAKMILGALEQNSVNRKIVPVVFQLLEKKYTAQSGSFFRYIYYNLLSETNNNFLEKHLNQAHFQELLAFYQTSSFDEVWHPIIQESFYRIYHKLSFANQQNIHRLIVDKSNALKETEHQVKAGGEVAFFLVGIVPQTEIRKYPLFVQNCVELLEYLGECLQDNQYKQGETSEEDEHYSLISHLYDKEIAVENTVFIVLQLLFGVSTELLLPYKSRLLNFRKQCPITAWLDLEEILVQLQEVTDICQELMTSIQEVKQLPDGYSVGRMNEWLEEQINTAGESDESEESPEEDFTAESATWDAGSFTRDYLDEDFPPALMYLSGAIYKAGQLAKKLNHTQLKALMIEAAELYLEKIFHPNAIEATASRQTSETIIQGLVLLDTSATYDLIFDYIHRLEHDLVIDIPDDIAFHNYINKKFEAISVSFEEEFGRLCKALHHTWNGRYAFAQYRERLGHLFFSVLTKHHSYFANTSMDDILQDEKQAAVRILEDLLHIPFFAYDRKFFIDKIIDHEHQYEFLKFYAVPFLFEMNFPFFQERYWQYIKQLEPNTNQPLELLELLTDNSFYYYSSNLKHIKEVLCRVSKWIQIYKGREADEHELEPDFHSYAYNYLIIISNALRLMKKSGTAYEDRSLLACIGVILGLDTVKEYLKNADYLETLDATDMMAYILYYHYTSDADFLILFNYEELKAQHPQTQKELLTDLVDLMTSTASEISLDHIHALRPVLGEAFYQDVIQYTQDYDVLYTSIEPLVFEKKLYHRGKAQ